MKLFALRRALPALLIMAGVFAFSSAQAQNVDIYNDTKCKYEVVIVYQLTAGPNCNDVGTTTIISPPMSMVTAILPAGTTMYKAGATESITGDNCAVYSPTACGPGNPQICGKFGRCKAYFGWSSSTVLKFVN